MTLKRVFLKRCMFTIGPNNSFAALWHILYELIEKIVRNCIPCLPYRAAQLRITELFPLISSIDPILYPIPDGLNGVQIRRKRGLRY